MDNSYEQDIRHIRSMMERSTRFISLNGWSGIIAGIFALLASAMAYVLFRKYGIDYFGNTAIEFNPSLVAELMVLGIITFLAAFGAGIYFTMRKSRKQQVKIWNKLSQRLLLHLFIPLFAGGIFCIALYSNYQFMLIAPVTLIFYGLALINASKYTFGDIVYLGYSELALGLASLFYIGYGLVFWAIGFGVLHIVYGIVVQKKYH